MANTEADLARVTLENVGVLAAGQSIAAEDMATVKQRIPLTIAWLIAKGVAIDSDTVNLNDIPDAIFLSLAAAVAYQCAQPFAADVNKRAELKAYAEEAVRDLTLYYRQGFPRRRLKIPHIGRCPIGFVGI